MFVCPFYVNCSLYVYISLANNVCRVVITVLGKRIILDAEPNDTILCIKQKVWDKEGILVRQQRLVFAGSVLQDNHGLSYYNIARGSTLHLVLRFDEEDVKGFEHLEMDKVSDIMIDGDSFMELLSNTLHHGIDEQALPKEILMEIYAFSRTFGGNRNFHYFGRMPQHDAATNALHDAATENDVRKVDELLKSGYFVDQWSVAFHTPLVEAVRALNVEMVEFLLLNGARRRIRSLVSSLKTHWLGIASLIQLGAFENLRRLN